MPNQTFPRCARSAHEFLLNLRKSQLLLFPCAGFAGATTGGGPFGGTAGPAARAPAALGTTGFLSILEPLDMGPTVNGAGWCAGVLLKPMPWSCAGTGGLGGEARSTELLSLLGSVR